MIKWFLSLFKEIKKCSIDHDEYKSGVDSCIKHGYYVDHRIQCPECLDYLEPPRCDFCTDPCDNPECFAKGEA